MRRANNMSETTSKIENRNEQALLNAQTNPEFTPRERDEARRLIISRQIASNPDAKRQILESEIRKQENAINATKKFHQTGRLSGKIPDGFIDPGRSATIKDSGLIKNVIGKLTNTSVPKVEVSSSREILKVDRERDPLLKKITADCLAQIDQDTSDFDKIDIIAKAITKYSLDISDVYDSETDSFWVKNFKNQTAHLGDTLVKSNKTSYTLCRHFGLAFQVVAADLGLESSVVRGEMQDGDEEIIPHLWNEVIIDGEKRIIDLSLHFDTYSQNRTISPGAEQSSSKKYKYWDQNSQFLYSTDSPMSPRNSRVYTPKS